jgi:hypothetical protein
MTSFKIFKSKRNGKKLSFDGFIYNKRSSNANFTFWRCVKRTCKGTVRSENDIFVVHTQHNYERNYLEAEAACVLSNIKSRALTTLERPKDIIKNYVSGETQNLAIDLPKLNSMTDRVTKIRKK